MYRLMGYGPGYREGSVRSSGFQRLFAITFIQQVKPNPLTTKIYACHDLIVINIYRVSQVRMPRVLNETFMSSSPGMILTIGY